MTAPVEAVMNRFHLPSSRPRTDPTGDTPFQQFPRDKLGFGGKGMGTSTPQDNIEFSRRRFLRGAGGIAGGAVAVPLLAACAPSIPTAAPTRPAATVGTSSAASANGDYPSYVPFATGPKADFPASRPVDEDAF